MSTGWPSDPSSLDERNDDDNNLLIETWSSNVYKFNFDEAHDVLRQLISEVDIQQDILNPNLTVDDTELATELDDDDDILDVMQGGGVVY